MEHVTQSILIVDDMKLNLMVVEKYLLAAGYTVTTATSGSEALSLVEDKVFDLILLDIMMPEMDGYEVCRRIKKSTGSASIPIIFMTSSDSSDSLQTAFEVGGADYINKPVSKVELLSRVGNHLELQSRHSQLVSAKNEIDQSARNLETIYNTVQSGLIVVDVGSDVVVSANPAATELLGVSRDYIMGKKSVELLGSLPASNSDKSRSEYETVLTKHDGESVNILFRESDIIYEHKPARLISLSDISELKKNEQLRGDIDQLTRRDLKIPLNGIISMSEQLLYGDVSKGKEEQFLNLILESSYSMLQNVNTTHDLYKMEAGTYEFKHLKVDLVNVFNTIGIYHEQALAIKKLKIEVKTGPLPQSQDTFFVSGEVSLFISLFDQLIKNALESTGYNEVIKVDIKQVEQRAIIKIHSNSVVPEQVRSCFFEKYSTAGKRGAEGLGTYCAALIVSTLNGKIEMDTSPEDGTTITVEVPVYKD